MSSKHHEHRDEHKKNEHLQDQDSPTPEAPKVVEPAPNSECMTEDDAVAVEGRALTAEAQLELVQAELLAAKTELAAVNDKYLRKLADDVNFRKRMAREKEDSQRFAVVSLLGDLIPILDDFDRAVSSAESAQDYAILHDGIVLIRRHFGQLLDNKYGLKRIDALGKPFDPNHHEAVAMELGDEVTEPTVAEEFLPGYGLHERVIRTAKVKVKMPGPAAAPGPAASADTAQGEELRGTGTNGTDSPDEASGTV
jgi:molecular chaperone GrpE